MLPTDEQGFIHQSMEHLHVLQLVNKNEVTDFKATSLVDWHKEGPMHQGKISDSLLQMLKGIKEVLWEITALEGAEFTEHGTKMLVQFEKQKEVYYQSRRKCLDH